MGSHSDTFSGSHSGSRSGSNVGPELQLGTYVRNIGFSKNYSSYDYDGSRRSGSSPEQVNSGDPTLYEPTQYQDGNKASHGSPMKDSGVLKDFTDEISLSSELLVYRARLGVQESTGLGREPCRDSPAPHTPGSGVGQEDRGEDREYVDEEIINFAFDIKESSSDILNGNPDPPEDEYINLEVQEEFSVQSYESDCLETGIEDDVIITELDSISNVCSPVHKNFPTLDPVEETDSPRREPEMQEMDSKESVSPCKDIEDTPRPEKIKEKCLAIAETGKQIVDTDIPTIHEEPSRDDGETVFSKTDGSTNNVETWENPQLDSQLRAENKQGFRSLAELIKFSDASSSVVNRPETDSQIPDASNSFEEKIQEAIANIEIEENNAQTKTVPMTDDELEELKKKCLSRVRPVNPDPEYTDNSAINDFSNSQKLLKFLEESKEKDEKTKTQVKSVSYTIHPEIPKLGDLLSKPASDLSEEILSLHLGRFIT